MFADYRAKRRLLKIKHKSSKYWPMWDSIQHVKYTRTKFTRETVIFCFSHIDLNLGRNVSDRPIPNSQACQFKSPVSKYDLTTNPFSD